jgi:D-alanine transaminase
MVFEYCLFDIGFVHFFVFTNGANRMIVYFNGRYMPKEQVVISPDDRGFLFADGTYEVVRIYRGKPYRIKDHLGRFAESLSKIRIHFADTLVFESITEELITQNGLEKAEAALYIQITRGVAPRRHPFPDPSTSPTVYAYVYPVKPDTVKWESGVKVILVPDIRWSRCDIKSVSLLANVLAAQEASDQEAEEAVFVRNGFITEGTHTNVSAVFAGEVWTHPANEFILGGITREAVRELCLEAGIGFLEKPIPYDQFMKADEAFLLGTTTEIMPVVEVNGKRIGTGRRGPVTKRLQELFDEMTRQ